MWEGKPKASEHRTLGDRAWCFQDKEYCYPNSLCPCCHEADGWRRAWIDPDGVTIYDDNDEKIGTLNGNR